MTTPHHFKNINMKQVFNNGSDHDRRMILIEITEDHIEFFFNEYYLRKLEWIESETEKRLEHGQDDLTDEDLEVNGFYWVGKDDWISDRTKTRQGREDNWHYHMMQKNWFTQEMKDWIDKNTTHN